MEQQNYEKLINAHLDKVDGIKEDMRAKIETLFDNLNMKQVLKTPDAAVNMLIDAVVVLMVKKYSKPLMKEVKEYVARVDNTSQAKG